MVEKVTREERMVTLMKEAAEKAIEILGNKDDFMDEDLTGEDVKLSKPKAEKVPDAKGSDSQKAHIRDAIGSDKVKKARMPFPNTLLQSQSEPPSRYNDNRASHKHSLKPIECDGYPDCRNNATQECSRCGTKLCDECAEKSSRY